MRLAIVTGAMISLAWMGVAQADAPAPLPPLFVPPPPINPITEFFHEIVVGSVLDTQPAAAAPPAVQVPAAPATTRAPARTTARR